MTLSFNNIAGVDPFNLQAIGYDDLVGAEELIGADTDVADFLGIGAAPGRVANARAQAIAKMQRGKQIVNVQPQNARMLMIGGTATQGATAGFLEITIKAQEPVRPQRMTLGAVTGAGADIPLSTLIINDIKVGTRSQLAANGALPANLFSGDNTGGMAGFQWDTVQPGCDLVIQFRLVAAAATVSAGIFAMALR
jgi:hypothetical protein